MPSTITLVRHLCDFCLRLFENQFDAAVHERTHSAEEILRERQRRLAMVKPIFLTDADVTAGVIQRSVSTSASHGGNTAGSAKVADSTTAIAAVSNSADLDYLNELNGSVHSGGDDGLLVMAAITAREESPEVVAFVESPAKAAQSPPFHYTSNNTRPMPLAMKYKRRSLATATRNVQKAAGAQQMRRTMQPANFRQNATANVSVPSFNLFDHQPSQTQSHKRPTKSVEHNVSTSSQLAQNHPQHDDFVDPTNLIILHRSPTDPTVTVAYECRQCQSRFTTSGAIRRHCTQHATQAQSQTQDSSGRDRPCACDYCPQRFTDQTMVKRHVDAEHLGNRYDCSVCPRRYKFTSARNLHERNAHGLNRSMRASDPSAQMHDAKQGE